MIIYEVNLTIQATIYTEYFNWLQEHIKEMIQLPGFQKAQLFEVLEPDSEEYHLCVQYEVETMTCLEQYFEHHASNMQQISKDLFENQLSTTHRILKLQNRHLDEQQTIKVKKSIH